MRLSEQDISFEDLLTDLEASKRTIEKEQDEIQAYRREMERMKAQLRQKEERLEEQREKILKEANDKANAILREAKEVADETIKNFHRFGKENISAAEMERERERLRKKIKDTSSAGKCGSTDGHPEFAGAYIRSGDHRGAESIFRIPEKAYRRRTDQDGQVPLRQPGDQPAGTDGG